MNWYTTLKLAARPQMSLDEALKALNLHGTPATVDDLRRARNRLLMVLNLRHKGELMSDTARMTHLNNAYDAIEQEINRQSQPQDQEVPFGGRGQRGGGYGDPFAGFSRGGPEGKSTRRVPEWQTDERSSVNYSDEELDRKDFRFIDWNKREIWRAAKKAGGRLKKTMFVAFDGAFFRSMLSAFANPAVYALAGRLMADWNSKGANPYRTEAVLAEVSRGRYQVIWLHGKDVSGKGTFVEGNLNDQSMMREMRHLCESGRA
jgi:hypothetical protein